MNINTNGIGAAPVSYGRIGNDSPVGAAELPRASLAGESLAAKSQPDLQRVSVQQVHQAVASLNRAVQTAGSNLHFTVDESTHEPIVRVVDSDTGQMIRQIPSKEALAVAQSIDDFLGQGKLLDQQV